MVANDWMRSQAWKKFWSTIRLALALLPQLLVLVGTDPFSHEMERSNWPLPEVS